VFGYVFIFYFYTVAPIATKYGVIPEDLLGMFQTPEIVHKSDKSKGSYFPFIPVQNGTIYS
jgi:hypothetical protein